MHHLTPAPLAALFGGLLAAVFLALPAAAETFSHDGIDRSYLIDIPEALDTPAPVVFALHGGGGDAARKRRFSHLHETGAEEGFVTVYPDGIGKQWNDAREAMTIRANQGGEYVDDVGFLTALARDLTRKGIADPRRIYVTGASNGGMMAFRLACEAADVFAAFAPVIASLPEKAETACEPSRPVPLLMLNGTADRLIPWDGGPVAPMFPGDRGRVLSTDRTLEVFAGINRCKEAPVTDRTRSLGRDISLTVVRYEDCAAPLGLYRFDGMGHRWPEAEKAELPGKLGEWLGKAPVGFPAGRVIWGFFAANPMP